VHFVGLFFLQCKNYVRLGLEETERGKEEETNCEPANYNQDVKFVGREKNSKMKQTFM